MTKLITLSSMLILISGPALANDLAQAYLCARAIQIEIKGGATGDASIVNVSAGNFILSGGHILEITSPSGSAIPTGTVNLVSPSGSKRQALITKNASVHYLAGESASAPSVHVKSRQFSRAALKKLMAEYVDHSIANAKPKPSWWQKNRIRRDCLPIIGKSVQPTGIDFMGQSYSDVQVEAESEEVEAGR